jgi:DNA invertase Pin-like site-specific DNA recombinase
VAFRAAIYCRISQDRSGDGLGVQRQEEDCRALCERNGWEVVGQAYVDDDISAFSGKPRPAYLRLLRDISEGRVQSLAIWHPDRLHRSPLELEEFIQLIEKTRCKVATVQSGEYDLTTATGRMTARVVGAVARHESEHKSDRMRRRHRQLAAAGKDSGGPRPFGYEADRMTVRQPEASLIEEAARRALKGEPLRQIAVDWNARAITTVRGMAWDRTTLHRVLVSARISGRREVRVLPTGAVARAGAGRIIGEAEWPGIVSPALSDQLRAVLADPSRLARHSAGAYLLSGIAICGICGRALSGSRKSEHGQKVPYLRCSKRESTEACGRIHIQATHAEGHLSELIEGRLRQGPLPPVGGDDELGIADELASVQAQLERAAVDLASGSITRGEWEAMQGPLRQRLLGLQERQRQRYRATAAQDLPDDLADAWAQGQLSFWERRTVVRTLIVDLVIHPRRQDSKRDRFDPRRIEIRWA